MPCFETEGNGLRLTALTILPLKAVCVAEVDGVGFVRQESGKIRGCQYLLTGRTGFV